MTRSSPAPSFGSPGRAAQEMADALQTAWARAVADPVFQEACGLALSLQARQAREARRLAATWLHAWGLPTVDDVRQAPAGRNA
ncbi:MAG: hypothetical protein HYZ53_05750 [Planctomycetes bacterium]|nr:hypothetical protein [Planctomycetota bacterium]